MRYLLFLLLLPIQIFSTPISPRLERLERDLQSQPSSLENFWAEVKEKGTPLIEPIPGSDKYWVTFLWRGDPTTECVTVVGGFVSVFEDRGCMERLGSSDVWYKTFVSPSNVRTTYLLSQNGTKKPIDMTVKEFHEKTLEGFVTWKPDPLNPRKFYYDGESGLITSIVELPAAKEMVWSISDAKVPKGKVTEHSFKSHTLDNERTIWVYTPAGYSEQSKGYPLVLLFDGERYLQLIPTPTILDNLIAKGKIPPTIACFVSNASENSRAYELPCNPQFSHFISRELIPWVRRGWHVTSHPSKTVAGGSSYGGLAASYIALKNPTIFGRVLSQSGTYWWKPEGDQEHEWLTKQYAKCAKLPIHFYVDIGRYEKEGSFVDCTSMGAATANFVATLEDKGYHNFFQEFPGGHDYIAWEDTLSDGLTYLLKPSR